MYSTQNVILNSIGDAVITTDIEGRVELLNPKAEQLTGWALSEAKGLPLSDIFNLVNPQTWEKLCNPVERVLQTDAQVGIANHSLLISRNGATYQISDSASPIREKNGSISGVVLVFRDVTMEHALQKRLQESEARYRDMFELNRAVKLLINPETGRIIEANSAASSFYQYSREALSGMYIWDINTLGESETRTLMKKSILSGCDFETKHRLASGEVRDVHVFSGPYKSGSEHFLHSVVVDITKRKQTEEALRESEQKFKMIAENTSDGILVFNEKNDLLYVSPSYDLQLGREIGETQRLTSKELSHRIHPEERPVLRSKIYSAIEAKCPSLVYTYKILHNQGHYVSREDHTRFNFSPEGVYLGAYVVSRDVTERVKDKELLRKNTERIQRQAQEIAMLAMNEDFESGNFTEAMRLICNSATSVLGISRASIWKYHPEGNKLECLCICDTTNGELGIGQLLDISDYPRYFEALRQENLISADDAQTDPRTNEFTDVYLKVLGITSMMDAGIHVGGSPYGSLCLEHIGDKKAWQPDEKAFASSLATLIAQAVENAQRRKAELALVEKQAMLTRTEAIAQIGSWELNLVNQKIEWSEEMYRIFKLPISSIPPTFEEQKKFFDPTDILRLEECMEASIRDCTPYLLELKVIRTDGELRVCQVRGFAHKGSEGKAVRLYGSFQDITDFKRIEQSLKSATEILNDAQRIAKMGSYEIDFRTGKLVGSESFLSLYNMDPAIPHHMNELEELLHPEEHDAVVAYFFKCVQERTNYNTEYSVQFPDGRRMYVSSRSNIDYAEDGTPLRIYGIKQDITERKLAEKALQESEERYHSVVSALSEGVVVQDMNSRITLFNESACEILGLSEEQLMGKTSYDADWQALKDDCTPFLPEEHPSMVTIKTGIPQNNVIMYVHKPDNQWVTISINSRPIRDDKNQLNGVVCSFVDITESRRAQFQLIQSEQRNRAMLSVLPDVLFRINDQLIFVDCHANDLSKLTMPKELFLGKSIAEVLPEKLVQLTQHHMQNALNSKELQHYEYEIEFGNSIQTFEARMVPCGEKEVIIISRDITQSKRAEIELQKMEKLQSIGTLAGGIAHDFNNIMTGLFANISLAKMDLDAESAVYKSLEEAEKSMNRAIRLTQQLLTFAKGGTPIKENVNLGELVLEVARFDLSGSKVKPVITMQENLWLAKVDKGQIQQVFSNLIINAKQSMDHGGQLFIHLSNVHVAREEVPTLEIGNYIKATIRDQGSGIAEEFLERIFDPYFTTKKTGNGLGLATVYSIISKHGGLISVESKLGVGTLFTLYVPATDGSESENSLLQKSQTSTPMPIIERSEQSMGRILVLDDELAILKVCKRMLEKKGFDVETAALGEEAVRLFSEAEERGEPFDVAIIDLTIPGGMGGKEAVQEILKINPDARCIVSSGYAEDPVMANFEEYGFRGVAVKPYTLNKLLDVLKQVRSKGKKNCLLRE